MFAVTNDIIANECLSRMEKKSWVTGTGKKTSFFQHPNGAGHSLSLTI